MNDLIDRNDAIEAIKFKKIYMTAYNSYVSEGNPLKQYNKGLNDAIKAVNSLAPAEIERITGHWIDTDNYYQRWKYSECGYHTRDAEPNYCPHCGAKME